MNILKKRIIPCLMAGVLAVSMAVPAFAGSTTVTGGYEAPDIEVTVPANTTAVINPLGLPVSLKQTKAGGTVGDIADLEDTTAKITGQQIVSNPMFITNDGEVPMKVNASVKTTLSGDLKLTAHAPASTDTMKNAYVYLQLASTKLVEADKAGASAASVQGFDATKALAEFTGWNYNAPETPKAGADGEYEGGGNDSHCVVLTSLGTGAKGENLLVLSAADKSSGTAQWVEGSVGKVRLAGEVVTSPMKEWTAHKDETSSGAGDGVDGDGFTVTIEWSFRPDTTTVKFTFTGTDATIDNTGGGVTEQLEATLSDSSLTIEEVDWSTSVAATATVAADGTGAASKTATVTAVADGDTVITAKVKASNGVTYTGTITITVKNT